MNFYYSTYSFSTFLSLNAITYDSFSEYLKELIPGNGIPSTAVKKHREVSRMKLGGKLKVVLLSMLLAVSSLYVMPNEFSQSVVAQAKVVKVVLLLIRR